jgi:hypothetical protein
MARILRGLAGLVAGVLLLAVPAQASIIPVTLQFTNPTWSGTVSFDDTTGQPWSVVSSMTAYEIADMSITDGVTTWTEGELNPSFVPPTGGVILDTNGRAALWIGLATDMPTTIELRSLIDFGSDLSISGSTLLSGVDDLAFSRSFYIGSVAAAVSGPGTLLLVAPGLMGLGSVAWRRRW